MTPNNSELSQAGPNNFQNYPVFLALANFGSSVRSTARSTRAPSTIYTIQFFGGYVADPSGHGQGQFLLGTISLTTDSSGNAAFIQPSRLFPPVCSIITATATDPLGNTSEFAQDVPLIPVQHSRRGV